MTIFPLTPLFKKENSIFFVILAFAEAQWSILEPIMLVEVSVPLEFSQGVTIDLVRKSGIVVSNESTDELFFVQAEVNN